MRHWLLFLITTLSCFFKLSELSSQHRSGFLISFYNVENLFDTRDDPRKQDNTFTPEGKHHWSKFRFFNKLSSLSQVIRSIGQGMHKVPDIIGLAEVENRYVLEQLIRQDALVKYDYKIIHKDSPDRRGIDVALLYRKSAFDLITYCTIPIISPKVKTRDILYVVGVMRQSGDTLHTFVNHFPSRWGGKRQSESKRVFVATKLKEEVSWCFKKYPKAKIAIIGDFNDTPEDVSVRKVLGAVPLKEDEEGVAFFDSLVNISRDKKILGSYIYRGKWQQLDQIIISDHLLRAYDIRFYNVSFPMLFDYDKRKSLKAIRRTYKGFRYLGGVSDHLPVCLRLGAKKI